MRVARSVNAALSSGDHFRGSVSSTHSVPMAKPESVWTGAPA